MVDRIADWKLTPRLKLMVFFFHFDSLKNTREMKHGLSTEQ